MLQMLLQILDRQAVVVHTPGASAKHGLYMFLIVKFGQRSGLLRDAVRDGDSQTFRHASLATYWGDFMLHRAAWQGEYRPLIGSSIAS